ncbi:MULTISPECIES: putative quinol monooxygenase [Deinococcus]|uniref:Quinol monooxygenase n=1 Tax=Deinococcus rufus TaxID=2136097 RepID=A0ABV7Z5Z4_9DEIO|nr:putative quinol monooxygenase [Deinococcus sp. AB2017081]WQE95777.1 putative quinol monooxygenase [Deinococcus sp. AB2017081]
MIISHGTLSTPPEHAEGARTLLRQVAQASRQDAGCTLYVVSEDLEQPGHFVITEHWDSMADMQAHLALPGVGEAVAAAHAMGATDLTITAYEGGAQTRIM